MQPTSRPQEAIRRPGRWPGFRATAAWQARSEATRAKWGGIYRQALEAAGSEPLSAITPKTIRGGLERRAHTPGQAQHSLNTMRALFRWALKMQLIRIDPTAGVAAPARRRDAGIRPWTEEDVAAYESRWPIGTRQRVWLDMLLYTGLRRGDAVRLGKQHVRDGIATIKTEKTGTIVTIPILSVLAETLAAGPHDIEDAVDDLAHRPLARPARGAGFRQVRRDHAPLCIGQIGLVSGNGTAMLLSSGRCPHGEVQGCFKKSP